MRSRTLSTGMAVVAAALVVMFAGALCFSQSPVQQSSSNQSGSQSAVLRVSTRMVQVNVIVQDKNGQPVTGLTKDDFTVFDKGQPQKISFFAEQNSQPSPVSTSTAEASALVNLFSNRLPEGSRSATKVTVILLDAVNTGFSDMSYARSQVLKFIRQVRPDDQVAIYLLTSTKLYMLHDLTNSSATLVRVMGGVKRDKTSSDPETVAADAENKRLNNALTDVAAESNRFYKGTIIDRVGVTSWGLGNIAVRLAKFPGRKNLVWVSSAFPIQTGFGTAETASIGGRGERHSYGGAISSIAQALSNADVAVYPVDARGLIPPDTLTVLQGACSGCPAPVQSSAPPDDRPFETMNSLAAGTGGRAFYNGNDLAAEIRSAIDDSRVTYVLGYYPGHNDWDGSFREIKVKVNRSGVQLRYRDGYFATAESSETADIQKHALTTALRSPVQILDLGLEVQINPIDAPGARQIRAQIHVLPGQMHFEQSGDRWTDGVEIAWSELSADGRVVGSGAHGLGIKPAKKGYDEIGQMGFTFSERVTVKNDAVEMRLVVRDTGSGAIGSVNIPLAGLFAPPPAKK